MTTPTKPTIDSLIEDFVSEHTNGYYVKGKLTESFKQSLLQLVLDEVIPSIAPKKFGWGILEINGKKFYMSKDDKEFEVIQELIKELRQRAREVIR